MRHIYLIRHGRPEFPNEVPCCIGRTDFPLSQAGLLQAQKLGSYFGEIPLESVYCSPLTRAVQTAEEIARSKVPVYKVEALQELYCGVWEGLTFEKIKSRYPELYAKRGTDPLHYAPEQSERFPEGLARFRSALEQIIQKSSGNIAIVAHTSVNRLLLCSLLQKSLNELYSIRQPYGCINELILENGILQVGRIGFPPQEYPDEDTIRSFWKQYHTPEKVIAHCRAVAQKAMKLTDSLADNGYELNRELIYSAAMLHDIARTEPDHPAQGAKWIAKEGYENVAAVIAVHHDLNEGEQDLVSEKTIVFLADKLICEDKEVSLEERFAKSILKCTTPEARSSHKRKQEQATAAYARVQRLLEKNS